ncbi:MAG: hypothetical protein EON52_15295 [Actinomycetales bacterium]|nr:MAG: hypothetical protein EON52_15295 [Actinomycetales bacterium]
MVRRHGRVFPRDPVVGEYGRRGRNLPAPPAVVWADLVSPRTEGPRPWLRLLDDEVPPQVLESSSPGRVVWSSLWPSRPTDWIDMTLEPEDGGTHLTFVVLTDAPPPDASKRGHVLKRINQLLFADLRFTYGQ